MPKPYRSLLLAPLLFVLFTGSRCQYTGGREDSSNADSAFAKAHDTASARAADSVQRGAAVVEDLSVQEQDGPPLKVRLVVKGYLPDGCTKLDSAIQRVEGNTIFVALPTVRPQAANCTMAIVQYQKIIPLDITGLTPGAYRVDVNGTVGTFQVR